MTMRIPTGSNITAILAALFIGVPLLDLMTVALIGKYMGLWTTLAILILSGVIGARLAQSQGVAAWRSLQADLQAGRVPEQGVMDCVLILIAGGMMVAPGFLTDIAALLLLLPPVRAPIKRWARRRIEAWVNRRITRPY
jgi:UPF0716 protein FxsA